MYSLLAKVAAEGWGSLANPEGALRELNLSHPDFSYEQLLERPAVLENLIGEMLNEIGDQVPQEQLQDWWSQRAEHKDDPDWQSNAAELVREILPADGE
jgi:hypothetical protein